MATAWVPYALLELLGFFDVWSINRSVFLNTALIQWAFHVRADPAHPIDDSAFTESANAHPMPFKVIFEPRVAKTFEGIRDLFEDYTG